MAHQEHKEHCQACNNCCLHGFTLVMALNPYNLVRSIFSFHRWGGKRTGLSREKARAGSAGISRGEFPGLAPPWPHGAVGSPVWISLPASGLSESSLSHTLVRASLCKDTYLGGGTALFAWNPHSVPTIHSHPWLGPLPKGLPLAFGPSACVCVCVCACVCEFSGLCGHTASLCICVLVGGLLKAGYTALP